MKIIFKKKKKGQKRRLAFTELKHEYHQSRLEFGKDANIKILEYHDHNRTNTMTIKSAKHTLKKSKLQNNR